MAMPRHALMRADAPKEKKRKIDVKFQGNSLALTCPVRRELLKFSRGRPVQFKGTAVSVFHEDGALLLENLKAPQQKVAGP